MGVENRKQQSSGRWGAGEGGSVDLHDTINVSGLEGVTSVPTLLQLGAAVCSPPTRLPFACEPRRDCFPLSGGCWPGSHLFSEAMAGPRPELPHSTTPRITGSCPTVSNLHGDLEASRQVSCYASLQCAFVLLWICRDSKTFLRTPRWPDEGPGHIRVCAPLGERSHRKPASPLSLLFLGCYSSQGHRRSG